jgi:tRNA (guanine10-N2)-methyltransferase
MLTLQPAPGKIIYDPFAGTGSLLYAVAHWGAYVFGSDIDGRQMRGKSESSDQARARH